MIRADQLQQGLADILRFSFRSSTPGMARCCLARTNKLL